MSLDVAQRAAASRRRRFWLLAAAGLAAALLLSGAVALLLDGEPRPSATPSEPTEPAQLETAATPEIAPSPAPAGTWAPPERQVVLPDGTEQIDELPVGFPRTPEGAAAAEVAKDRYSSTLDYQLANTVARVYVAPELAATADQASTAAVRQLRATLGVDEAGPPPVDASATTRPFGVQWTELGEDRVEVSVLVQVDYRTPDRAWSELAASTTVWQWMDGAEGRPADWRLVDARAPDAALAEIGTRAFNDEGWSAIVTETAR